MPSYRSSFGKTEFGCGFNSTGAAWRSVCSLHTIKCRVGGHGRASGAEDRSIGEVA